jgi:two-component system sensor histidine kinase EvgS
LRALKAGQVDMLGTANGFEASDADILLSTPYAIDQPVLVTRETKPARSPRAWPVCA